MVLDCREHTCHDTQTSCQYQAFQHGPVDRSNAYHVQYLPSVAAKQYKAAKRSELLEEVSVQNSHTGKKTVGLAIRDTTYVDDEISEPNIHDQLMSFLDDHPEKITLSQLNAWGLSMLHPVTTDLDGTMSSLSHEAKENTKEQDASFQGDNEVVQET